MANEQRVYTAEDSRIVRALDAASRELARNWRGPEAAVKFRELVEASPCVDWLSDFSRETAPEDRPGGSLRVLREAAEEAWPPLPGEDAPTWAGRVVQEEITSPLTSWAYQAWKAARQDELITSKEVMRSIRELVGFETVKEARAAVNMFTMESGFVFRTSDDGLEVAVQMVTFR